MRPVPLVAVPRVYIFAAASLGQKLIIANQDNPPFSAIKRYKLGENPCRAKICWCYIWRQETKKGVFATFL